MSGVIQGGWEFIWSAYGVTALVLLFYTASVLVRYRKSRKQVTPMIS